MIKIIISLIAIYILNVIDYFQTIYAVQLFGLGIEINPIVRFLFENNCEWIKLILIPILLVIQGIIVRKNKKQSWAVYLLLIGFSFVVTNNFIVLWRLQVLNEFIKESLAMIITMVVCAIITGVSAIACGALCAYYKHLKNK